MADSANFCFVIFFVVIFNVRCGVSGLYEFPPGNNGFSAEELRIFSKVDKHSYSQSVQLAVSSINLQYGFETNLVNSDILVKNGSVSHAQLLETLPNDEAKEYDKVARKILKASVFFYNLECAPRGINKDLCARFLSTVSLPRSQLKDECIALMERDNDGPFAFRRLLPANYQDGLYTMYTTYTAYAPTPRQITSSGINSDSGSINIQTLAHTESIDKNIVLVQWAQFIEHDLSKSVVTTMLSEGVPIECCNSESYALAPRYIHPECEQLEINATNSAFGRRSCLNYVRSAVALQPECKFGPAQQLNQASNLLDLSQLYGFSRRAQNRMRMFSNGYLKTSPSENQMPLLPLADTSTNFCVTSTVDETCFMAGDSRVNTNPYVASLYTIFLRRHNQIASILKSKYPKWDDERLYNEAKKINSLLYRSIIYHEWLPAVLGQDTSDKIKNEPIDVPQSGFVKGVSNEFAVAAIRFYYSMMPDILNRAPAFNRYSFEENVIDASLGNPDHLLYLKEHFYKPEILSKSKKIDTIFEAMFLQKALNMDASYAEDLTKNFLQTKYSLNTTSGTDALAWDIQRGRDHGLSDYVHYLEACTNTKIYSWNDLTRFMDAETVNQLKEIYGTYGTIDLIIGGISEKPVNGSTVGPTFTCILAEQFSNTRKTQSLSQDIVLDELLDDFNDHDASKLMCLTTNLVTVPRNIFYTPSERNPLVRCSDI